METKLKGNIYFNNKKYTNLYLNKQVYYIQNYIKYKLKLFQKNECIAIYMNRDPKLLSIMFSLFELKICFLIIDDSMPSGRIQYMLNNSNIRYIITDKFLSKEAYEAYNIISISDILKSKFKRIYKEIVFNSELAYQIYTSGSTGNPKAIEIYRYSLLNFFTSISKKLNIVNGKRILCSTETSFDIFLLESLHAMIYGQDIVLATNEEIKNPWKLMQLIMNNKIDYIQMTPSRIRQLQMIDKEFKFLKNVKSIFIGGENFPLYLLDELKKYTTCEIYNLYGPSEATIWVTHANLTKENKVSVGKPIDNVEIVIVNNQHSIIKNGNIGEIVILGNALAKGYKNNIELTNKKFINNFLDNKRAYFTGDKGKIDKKGNLVILGRLDNQIKLFGHRIELDEIDYIISNLGMTDSCISTIFKEKIITFYISHNQVNIDLLLRKLKEQLPIYMIPSDFVKVDHFEYTFNNKIDIKSMCNKYQKSKNNKYSVKNEVIELILNHVNNIEINGNTKISDMRINSLTLVKIIVSLEQKYNIEFSDNYFEDIDKKCINDILDYLKEKGVGND